MSNIGISFHIRGRSDGSVTVDDAEGVFNWGIFCAESLFTLLSLVDEGKLSERLAAHGGDDYTFQNIGELGVALIEASLWHTEKIKSKRETEGVSNE
ncbi:MAG TPA: hypothetical protein VE732_02965 [Nitrososphaera sp.]|nr:hypothetical protein [Nitrososphaera sp.]